jgi:hypothetical protein
MLVGYASNSKAYRVFNNSTRVIEETCDVEFDESNGSQGDGFCCDDVEKEPLREAMKKMAIGDIKPKEDDDSHSIHEDSSSDDDDNDDQPRCATSSPTRQNSPSSSQELPPISQDTQDQVEKTEEVQSQMIPPLQHLEGVKGLQQTIQLMLSWVIPRGVQGLAASNMPHFVNIMLLSLL